MKAPARRWVASTWNDPLLRTGHVLTVNSALTALIGLGFWTVAARRYDTVVVGRSAAVIAAMTLLGGVAQLNLMSALVRFVPIAGRRTARLVGTTYLVSAVVAAVLGVGFLVVAPAISDQFDFVTGDPLLSAGFVAATMAWTVFVLQDAALTGLHRAPVVVVENTAFAVVKVLMVAVAAGTLVTTGIVAAWWIGLAAAVAGTNAYLFLRAIPQAMAPDEALDEWPGPSWAEVARFTGPDYVGALAWMGATTAMAFLVLARLGATANAYFSIAWAIGFGLFLFSANMGQSLVVESAQHPGTVGDRWRHLLRRSLVPLTATAAAVIVAAPLLLRLFGTEYTAATGLLRLVAAAAVPNLVTATAVSTLRAQSRTRAVAVLLVVLSAAVLVLATLLIGPWGLTGVGLAWFLVEGTAAAGLLLGHRRWLPPAR